MKRLYNKLLTLGNLDIQSNYHKLFKETATQAIDGNPQEYVNAPLQAMKDKDQIIRVEFAPKDKPMPPALAYHWDIEEALKSVYNQYLIWEPEQ